MEHHISNIIGHMAKSHEELAHILQAGRDLTVHMSYLIDNIPDQNMSFMDGGKDALMEEATELNGSVTAYLNSIGELEDAIGDNLKLVMKQIRDELEQE